MDAFLFDLDGLLVDSEPQHFKAFVQTAKYFGYEIDWDFDEYCKKAHTQSMGLKKAFLDIYPQAESEWQLFYHTIKLNFSKLIEKQPLNLMPGVEAFIKLVKLHKKKIAVVTNSSTPMVLAICEKQPFLKTIPLWITREDYEHAKPAPDGYLKALEIMNVSPEKSCGFEDSPRGVKALKAAGILAFHIHSYSIEHEPYFSNFNQLISASSDLFN
jgi:beta-phosphoglucomutase